MRRSGATEVAIVREVLTLEYEGAKHMLVTATGDEVLRLQGKAKAMKTLIDDLTKPAQTGAVK